MTAQHRIAVGIAAFFVVGVVVAETQLPAVGAALLLHPPKQHVTAGPPSMCEDAVFAGAGISLSGWRCGATTARRGTLVYLHGISDNRTSGAGIAARFTKQGFDVIAYDGRAQGESGGGSCTYGFFEKEDLRRVLDHVAPGPVVLLGSSLGAAVALQEAAIDSRISAVVADETFSDLRTVVTERAPFIFTSSLLDRALHLAEREANFDVDAVSPVKAAANIHVPVFLIHGTADHKTLPAHSQRVFDALAGPKRLLLVPGAGHSESLRGSVWTDIDSWLASVLGHS